ncbi:hypothetical protein [Pseudoxanthomonas sp. PXM02]|uniref:hypothetical protein n=1 Tax=Pseudoxanthomonas sp. PXM02 TaxID=2769294 RepID=UPI00177FC135|nr:hypothetical protein [Pseudoxanthomonas sp. PXM02]MBD9478236.1 hypothetical protein [Pseudoxanthomonas sp. PXM02]
METLRSNGDQLRVSCEKRIEIPVDGPYMVECKKKIEALAQSLSTKWPAQLAPISTGKIRYNWSGGDCITTTTVCFCRYSGTATIPLDWTEGSQSVLPSSTPGDT